MPSNSLHIFDSSFLYCISAFSYSSPLQIATSKATFSTHYSIPSLWTTIQVLPQRPRWVLCCLASHRIQSENLPRKQHFRTAHTECDSVLGRGLLRRWGHDTGNEVLLMALLLLPKVDRRIAGCNFVALGRIHRNLSYVVHEFEQTLVHLLLWVSSVVWG